MRSFSIPTPLPVSRAGRRCSYQGLDPHYADYCSGEVAGYGLLRGWDQGYAVPSLGIAVSPSIEAGGWPVRSWYSCTPRHAYGCPNRSGLRLDQFRIRGPGARPGA